MVVFREGVVDDFVVLSQSARLDRCLEESLPDLHGISVSDEVLEEEQLG